MSDDSSNDDRGLEPAQPLGVSALATAALSALTEQHEDKARETQLDLVTDLVNATLESGTFSPERVLNTLTTRRILDADIVDTYIPAASVMLGQMWADDEISFAQVSIGVARLQGLLALVAPPWSDRPSTKHETHDILMVLQSGEDHTLGPHVASAQLRRAGASVRILFGPDADSLLRVLSEERYNLILFSCTKPDSLDYVAQMVKRVKTGFSEPPPIALGGIVLNLTDRVKEKTGVDLVTSDVSVVLKFCSNLGRVASPMAR